MLTIIKFFFIITILCFAFSQSSAQKNNLRLITLSGDTLNVCRIDSLSDIALFGSCNGKPIFVLIDSITVLERFKEGHFLNGAAIGTLIGAVTGIIIGAATYQKEEIGGRSAAEAGYGLIGAVGGFVIGGAIGASSDHYMIDFRMHKSLKMKRLIIQQAFIN
jgi:hypothetical protein